MTKLGSGVTMIEAAKFLGYWASPILLSRLVKHVNIPKWSRCKPVDHVGLLPADEQGFKEAMDDSFWGFSPDIVGHMNTDSQMFSSAITLSEGEVWHYSGVTASEETPARLADFRFCNDAAECPFNRVEMAYNVPGVEKHKGPVFQLNWTRNLSQNAEINPYDYDLFRNKPAYIVFRKENTNSGTIAGSGQISASFSGITGDRFVLESGDTGNYEACAVIYRENASEVWPLPNTYFKFSLSNQTEETYTGLRLENQCSMTRSSTVGQLTVRLKITNITNEQITAVVNALVYDSQATPHRLWPVNANNYTGETVTIAPGASLTFYGADNYLTTTQQEPIRIEDIGSTVRPPVAADCTTYNTLKQDVHITKTATILNS